MWQLGRILAVMAAVCSAAGLFIVVPYIELAC